MKIFNLPTCCLMYFITILAGYYNTPAPIWCLLLLITTIITFITLTAA